MIDKPIPNNAEISCFTCEHKWLLHSNKPITQYQFDIWFKHAIEEHRKLHGNKNDNI